MTDLVKAEAQAVRVLKHGVTTYAESMRSLANDIRRQVAVVEQRYRENVDARRSDLNKCEAEVRKAREALSRSEDDRRKESEHALRAAEERVEASKRNLDGARKAERAVSAAMSDLVKVTASVEALVGEHSSAASSALTTLDAKLAELTSGGVAAFARSAIVSIGVAAEVATTVVGAAQLAGNVSQGALPTANTITSTSQLQDWKSERDQELWAEAELDRRKNSAGALQRAEEDDE